MPVVANGGLVGSIIATTPHGATVRLISDVNSSVGVTFGNGKTSLVVSGRA
jgi:cell shape-determining protein MreC